MSSLSEGDPSARLLISGVTYASIVGIRSLVFGNQRIAFRCPLTSSRLPAFHFQAPRPSVTRCYRDKSSAFSVTSDDDELFIPIVYTMLLA